VTRVCLERWAAIAPGLDVAAPAWSDWARAPRPFPDDDVQPDMKFLPAMQRRRCDPLSRLMLAVANACCDDETRSEALSVFGSRHGSFGTTVSMLEALARDEALSPTAFSHSVHNTQAGLFSIWADNQQVAQSLAARNETFQHGLLEAVCLLARSGGRPVLFVTGDEALPEPVARLSDDPHPPYAVGLLLRAEDDPRASGGTFELALEPGGEDAQPLGWPPALEFVRWWLSPEQTLRLGPACPGFSFRRR
jgi:hypothetical protein